MNYFGDVQWCLCKPAAQACNQVDSYGLRLPWESTDDISESCSHRLETTG